MYGRKAERKVKCGGLKFNRIRVYFNVYVMSSTMQENEDLDFLYRSFELTPKQGEKLFNRLVELYPSEKIRFNRVQTSGSIGGIVLGGSIQTILKHN